MDDNENTVPINDPGDEYPQSRSKGGFFWTKPKQLCLILICAIIILIIYLITIITYIKDDQNGQTESEMRKTKKMNLNLYQKLKF